VEKGSSSQVSVITFKYTLYPCDYIHFNCDYTHFKYTHVHMYTCMNQRTNCLCGLVFQSNIFRRIGTKNKNISSDLHFSKIVESQAVRCTLSQTLFAAFSGQIFLWNFKNNFRCTHRQTGSRFYLKSSV
jgi:hypothetical protein